MLGRMIGAIASGTVARRLGGAEAGAAGTIIGLALPFAARRLGPLGMVGMAIGAWAVHRLLADAAADASPNRSESADSHNP